MRHIVLIVCLLLVCTIRAQGSGESVISLREDVAGTMEAVFDLGSVGVVCDVDGYSHVDVPGMTVANGVAGDPAVPTMSRLVQMPRGCRLTLGMVNGREEEWKQAVADSHPLRPCTGPAIKDAPSPVCYPNAKTYADDAWYRGGEPVQLEHLGTMGSREVYRLTVRPIAYNPVQGSLRLYRHLAVTIGVQASSAPHSYGGPERYLIVSRPEMREGLQPFVRWKRQQGFDVVELYVSTHQRDSIRTQMSPYWAEGKSWPQYVLLVGDAACLQSFIGTSRPAGMDNHTTDLYYVEHTGDYLPDACVGRWPVNDTAELGAVVRKTLRYEQCVDMDTAWLKRVLLVAGHEDENPAPITTNGQVNYLAQELAMATLDTLVYRNPASGTQRESIVSDLRQGVSVLNYTAHCTTSGWSSPSVSFSTIDTLDLQQPLLFVNNCCRSNDFSGTCFGEQLLRDPVGGAIGVIGATNSSLWNEDYYWAVGPKYPLSLEPQFDSLRPGAFDRWLGRIGDVHTQGRLLEAGNLAVSAFGSPYDKFYWEIYCLLGDPSLTPWVGVPRMLDSVVVREQPRNGDCVLHLAGTPGATVSAVQSDSLLGVGVIGSDSLLSLPLCVSIDTASLLLTATMPHGYRPRVDTLHVLPAEGMAAALREVVVTDSILTCRVVNVGTSPLYGLQIVLCQPDADSTSDALLDVQTSIVDTLLPQAGRRLSIPLRLSAVGQTYGWTAQLIVFDSVSGQLCRLTVRGDTHPAYPDIRFRLLNDDDRPAHVLAARQSYVVETSVEGSCDSMHLTVMAPPTGMVLADTVLIAPPTALRTAIVTPDTLSHLCLQASLYLDNHRRVSSAYLVAGDRMDCFESGMASYPWQRGGTQPWQLDSSDTHSGRYSMRSGTIGPRQTSDLTLSVMLPAADTLSYWVRTSSEELYDRFMFHVDGARYGSELSGEGYWRQRKVPLTAGRHVLRWRYVKDDSGDAGNDCVWIDDVRLPMSLWDSAYGWFGDTATLGLHPIAIADQPDLFPNPTSGRVTVGGSGEGRVEVVDLYGRVLHSEPVILPASLRLDILPDGVYLLRVSTPARRTLHKLIIRH